jgi:hypothetical protein
MLSCAGSPACENDRRDDAGYPRDQPVQPLSGQRPVAEGAAPDTGPTPARPSLSSLSRRTRRSETCLPGLGRVAVVAPATPRHSSSRAQGGRPPGLLRTWLRLSPQGSSGIAAFDRQQACRRVGLAGPSTRMTILSPTGSCSAGPARHESHRAGRRTHPRNHGRGRWGQATPKATRSAPQQATPGATPRLGQKVKPYDQNIVTFEAMFVGYTEARNRLEAASGGRSPAATYVPLFEALNWAHALDERVAAHWVPTERPLDSVGATHPQRRNHGRSSLRPEQPAPRLVGGGGAT